MAFSLPMGQYVQGSITAAGQTVEYDLTTQVNPEYVFFIQGADSGGGTLADPYASLYNGWGVGWRFWIKSNDNATPSTRDAKATFWSLDQYHSIDVSSADGIQTGTFTIWYAPAAAVLMGATPGDNPNLVGTTGNDTIDGLGGRDTMSGLAGNDTYYVNQTDDNVVENVSSGNDTIYSEVSYTIKANVETLRLSGSGNTRADGNGSNNSLYGNSGDNILDGKAGADIMAGGSGNDTYYVDNTGDITTETSTLTTEIDTVRSSVTRSLGLNLENLTLTGTAAIDGTGNALNNILAGNAAVNRLNGSAGNDTLNGGAGADTMIGGTGNDIYYVDNAGDLTTETSTLINEIDTVVSSVNRTLGANLERLTLTGTAAIDGYGNALNNTLIGNAAANRLDGFGGNDVLNGGAGIDNMIGGTGNDTYYVDNIGDKTTETSTLITEIDTVQSSVTRSLGLNLENLTLTGAAAIDGTGNALNNILTGNAAVNRLNSSAGNDTLNGGAGADTMIGGTGNDIYYVDNAGDLTTETSTLINEIDTVVSSVNRTLGANLERLTLTGTAAIDGYGNALNNTLTGNAAANRLDGGAGNDILNGGAGADTLIGGAGNDIYYVDNGLSYYDTVCDVVTEAPNSGTDIVYSSVSYTLTDNVEKLTMIGGAGSSCAGIGNALDNIIIGDAGQNDLNGGDGNDTLIGGLGSEYLTGGTGADVFIFKTIEDFKTLAVGGISPLPLNDIITYFESGIDKVDFSAIDADTNTAGNQTFSFTTGNFTGVAGQLRMSWGILEGDVNGDAVTDFRLDFQFGGALSSDFVL